MSTSTSSGCCAGKCSEFAKRPIGQIVWRGLCGVMAVFFAIAAYLQHNDPDVALWMFVYLVPCLLSLAIMVYQRIIEKIVWNIILILHMSGCSCGLLYLVISNSTTLASQGGNPFSSEVGREMGGLLLTVVWLTLLLFVSLKRPTHFQGSLWFFSVSSVLLPIVATTFWLFTVDLADAPAHCKDILTTTWKRFLS